MRESIFVLANENNKYVANRIFNTIPTSTIKIAAELDEAALIDMANNSLGEFFYVISTDKEVCFTDFKFTFTPPAWDKEYVHIWNNDTTVRFFGKDAVLRNASAYTDKALLAGQVQLKNIDNKIFVYPMFDIVFLSYDEYYADANFQRLRARFPYAKRISGVKGIYEAHKAAALNVSTDMFYVVDADAEVLPEFNFDYSPHSLDRESVHVWYSRNHVNGLEYGYGGIKLFPTNLLIQYTGSPIDFTTSVSKSFKLMPEVSNITRFDSDPFSAWRSGFRECVKLASRIISNQDDIESEERLAIWLSVGRDTVFGDFVLMGAQEGRDFGMKYANQPNMLGLINDFKWLEDKFNS